MCILTSKRRAAARARIDTMLQTISVLRGSSHIYKQVMGSNSYWKVFDEEEIMQGKLLYLTFRYSTKKLEELADSTNKNFQADLKKFMQIFIGQPDPTRAINVTLRDHSKEEKEQLETLIAWGRKVAGLKRLYETNGTIHLEFDGEIDYSDKDEIIDANNPNFISKIFDTLWYRQSKTVNEQESGKLLPDYLKQLQTAINCGLPNNLKSKFSFLENYYMDCFVVGVNGEQRMPDAMFAPYGVRMYLDEDAVRREVPYGEKVWYQTFEGELAVQIKYLKQTDENGLAYYTYEYNVLVAPDEISDLQREFLRITAENSAPKTIHGKVASATPEIFDWIFPLSRSFNVDQDFNLIPSSYKEINPEYYKVSGLYQHCTNEVVIHVMNEAGEIVEPSELVDEVSEADEQIPDEVSQEPVAGSTLEENPQTLTAESDETTDEQNQADENARKDFEQLVGEILQETPGTE